MLALALPVPALADRKSDDIRQMMSLGTGNVQAVEARFDAAVAPTIQRFAEAHPNIPPDALATLRAQIRQQELELFNAIEKQVSARYYTDMTDEEVRAVLAFYATPAGQIYLRESKAVGSIMVADASSVMPALIRLMVADFAADLKRQTPSPQAG